MDKSRLWTLGSHTTPEYVRAFMSEWAPAHGLMGGYRPQHNEEATS